MSTQYHKRLAHIRNRYPRAYERWSADEEAELVSNAARNATIEELCQLFRRQPGAIRSRLRKLEYSGSPPTGPDTFDEVCSATPFATLAFVPESSPQPDFRLSLGIEFTLEWRPVLKDAISRYLYPEPITLPMKQQYSGPAVYRWRVCDEPQSVPHAIYIGMTKKLCPDRLGHYLDPGDSNTNLRLSRFFQSSLQQGRIVILDYLYIEKVTIDGREWRSIDLSVQYQRTLVESLLIDHYRQSGLVLLN